MRAWWDAVPSAFRVARSPRGEVVAFTSCASSRACRSALLADDRWRAWRAHLRTQPVAAGERVLLARLALAWATGAAPSPCFARAAARPRARVAGGGPRLRRIYSAARGPALREQLEPIGYVALAGPRSPAPPDPARPRPRVRGQLAVRPRRPRPRPADSGLDDAARELASTATGSRSPSSSATCCAI